MTEKNVIKTDHFKTIDELIKTCSIWIKDDDYDAYYRFFGFDCMRELVDLIQNQQSELEKKDKIISEIITQYQFTDGIDVKNYCDDKLRKYRCIENCENCIKQYFEEQVEKE